LPEAKDVVRMRRSRRTIEAGLLPIKGPIEKWFGTVKLFLGIAVRKTFIETWLAKKEKRKGRGVVWFTCVF
jgi:hypothetical protein